MSELPHDPQKLELRMRVRLFALLRERAGAGTVELSLPPGATVADAIAALSRRADLGELLSRMPVAMAVNREYAEPSTELHPDDELALIPPLSGGSQDLEDAEPLDDAGRPPDTALHVRVCEEPLSRERLRSAVADPHAGAIVTFEGVTREVERLDYEAYEEMARERIERIAYDCALAHPLRAIAVEHRVGRVLLGEPSVIVAVSAAHRPAAFAAAREAIDRIKAEAPIWKRELDAGGAHWVDGTPAPTGPRPRLAGAARDEAAAARQGESSAPGGSTPGEAPAGEVASTEPPPGEAVHGGPTPGDALPGEAPPRLTHLDADGSARMVDVGGKPPSERVARARARLRMSRRAAQAVQAGDGPKGEVLGVARIAGIQAAKQTSQLIPLAHPLPLSFVDVRIHVDVKSGMVALIGEARTVASTGVEMEAMTACAVAALTVYDMVKGIERGIALEQVVLLEKRGGRSGHYRLEDS